MTTVAIILDMKMCSQNIRDVANAANVDMKPVA
jgi:hypothetical protein